MQFAFRYAPLVRPVSTLFGARRGTATVTEEGLAVRYGAVFTIDVPRRAIRSIVRTSVPWWRGIGAHGWRGRWLVNASLRDPVEIVVDPLQRGRMFRVIRPTVRSLVLMVEDPDGLIAAVGTVLADR